LIVNVVLFGATGMVGQGVLRECLRDAEIARVLAVGRSTIGQRDGAPRRVLENKDINHAAGEMPQR